MTQTKDRASVGDDSAVLEVTGVLDELTTRALRSDIREASAEFTRPLLVDVSEAVSLPSHAVGVLAVARREATEAGTTLRLRAAAGTLAQRVLSVCGLEHEG